MRSTWQWIAALGLAALWALCGFAVFGPHKLPDRIPIHFDAAGQINGWGSPAMLWLLPAVATGIYVLITLVMRHPSAFNFPVQVTPAARARLESMALDMIAWLRAEMIWLFLFIEWAMIYSARLGRSAISPWTIPLCVAVVFVTIGWHIAGMRRVGQPRPR